MSGKLISLIAIVLSVSVAHATTPTISGVSGTVSTGQTLTISGSNMVDEDKTNWGTAYKSGTKYGFEGSSYTADGYDAAPDMNPQERSYDSTVKIMGNQSFKGRIYGNSSSCPTDNHSAGLGTTIASDGVGSSTEYYVRLYSRWNSSGSGSQWPSSHIKMLDGQGRIYPADIPSPQWYLQPVAGSSLPTQMNMIYDGTNHNHTVTNFLQEDRWYAMEARFKTSAPANFTAWVDGVQLDSVSPSATVQFQYILFNIINACGFSNLDLTNWTDGFTISTSRIYPASTIEISNNATYGAGVVKRQEPVFLSDSSVQFKIDLSGLGGGPYYLWVTNNRQERVASGYNLTDSGSDTTAPAVTISTASPQNITVNQLTVTGTASDAVGVVGCEFRVGSAPDSAGMGTSCTGTTNFSCDTGGYASGTNSLYVACYDQAGNYGAATPITVSYIQPVVNLFSESFSDGSFAGRGWYDNPTHGEVVSGGVTGNSLKWSWAQSATKPTNGDAMRKLITPTDKLYLSFYVKFDQGWQGSQRTYHPHLITILSDLDGLYAPLANNYLNTYVEFISDVGAPYTIRPVFIIQDQERVNTSYGAPPISLVGISENRSATACNTPPPAGWSGVCYADNPYYSANLWKDPTSALSTDLWHRVEVYMQMNTVSGGIGQSNGIFRQWLNGVSVADYSNVLYRTGQDATKKWAQVVLSPWIGDGSPVAQSMYIDDLVVADGYVRSGATPRIGTGSAIRIGSGSTRIYPVQ